MAAAPTLYQVTAGAPLSSLPRSGFRALTDSAPVSVGRRGVARLEVKAAGNIFGDYFQVATYGESHGGGVGCVISGCPPRIPLTEEDMQADLDRRRHGQSGITTPRKETDTCKILSGTYEGMTTGTPIHVFVPNADEREGDYNDMTKAYRPSHADLTYDLKYGVRSVQGGGRASARETIGRVAAGALAKKILKLKSGVEILAFVSKVHQVVLPEDAVDYETVTLDQIENNICRCPDPEYAEKMIAAIDKVRVHGNSIGGVVTCIARNVPRGLGTPVFDKLEALLAKAMLSIPASKGFEIGSGFAAVPIVETMAALVLMDQLMAHSSQCEMFPLNLALQEPIGSASSTPLNLVQQEPIGSARSTPALAPV
ncbi:hypothetical protein ACQ4PT_032633 [Festuca glaucescens]